MVILSWIQLKGPYTQKQTEEEDLWPRVALYCTIVRQTAAGFSDILTVISRALRKASAYNYKLRSWLDASSALYLVFQPDGEKSTPALTVAATLGE